MGNKNTNLSRRNFLKVSLAAGSSLLIGIQLSNCNNKNEKIAEINKKNPDDFMPNAWIRINRDNTITIMINHTEMGQGITTALSMIVAEELEADWKLVRPEFAPVAKVYKNPEFGIQMTGSSTSVKTSWDILRKAGASARELLKNAAAETWKVPVSESVAEKSVIIHKGSGKRLKYGDLINKAIKLSIPENVKVKGRPYKITGSRLQRLDNAAKTDGSAVFGMDVSIPGMVAATVIHSPVIGGKARSINSNKSGSLPGVQNVLDIGSGVAVVADTFWHAKSGAEALEIKWDESEAIDVSSEYIRKQMTKLAETKEGKKIYKLGKPDDVFKNPAKVLESVYELPHQAHATPEPMNCTAYVREDRCDIWVPTQNQDGAWDIVAMLTGFDYDSIQIHTTYAGCGLGRRINVDYVAEAVKISQAIKKPVKLIWTQEENMKNDFYRPCSYNQIRAALDTEGYPVAWDHKIVGADYFSHIFPELFRSGFPYGSPALRNIAGSLGKFIFPKMIPGKKAAVGAAPLSYDIKNVKVNFVNHDPGIPLGFWRSVGYSSNAFIVESFMDEIAAAGNFDPYELRYRLTSGAPRLQNVIKTAAERSGWDKKSPRGIFRGIAANEYHGSLLAYVAEVSVSREGNIKAHRVTAAVDCGIVINPKIVEAQIRSGIVFGLTATIKSAATFRKGSIEQSNFNDFPLLRMDEMPVVEVYLAESDDPPTAIGEAGVPLIAPAVANAIYAATGKRVRKLPIFPEDIRKS